MASNPPVPEQNNAPAKSSSPSDWIFETQVPGPDGKLITQTSKVSLGQNQTFTAQSGAQYKLMPAAKAAKGKNKKLLDADHVISLQEGNDLRLVLPGGGVIFIKGFFDPAHKSSPTQLKITQADGSQELLANGSPVPAPAQTSRQEVDSSPGDSSAAATPPTPAEQPTASKDVGKNKSKGKTPNGVDDIDWMGGFDISSMGGLFALAGLGGGGGGGGSGGGAVSAATSVVSGTFTGGPAMVGNGLTVEIYDMDGNLLGSGKLSDQGVFSVNIGTYKGAVVAKVVDANVGTDFMDEATGLAKDLNAVFMSVAVVDGSSNQLTVNINTLTTLAALKAGFNPADGTGSVAGATAAQKIAAIQEANLTVAKMLGLSDVLTQITVVPTINADGSPNASANGVGKILAALSG